MTFAPLVVRLVAGAVFLFIYVAVFQPMQGFWPLVGLVGCLAGYSGTTQLVERRLRRPD